MRASSEMKASSEIPNLTVSVNAFIQTDQCTRESGKLGMKVRKAATLQGALGKTVNNRVARNNDGNWIASIRGADCAQRLRGLTFAGDICLGAQFAVRYAVK